MVSTACLGQYRGMTTNVTPSPYVESDTVIAPVRRGSILAAAVAVFLGGYILVQSLTGQLPVALTGLAGVSEVLPLLLGQVVFALVAVIVGLCLAPAPASRKLIGSVLVIIGTVVAIAMETARLTSVFGGVPVTLTLANAYFMVALFLGAAWLVVRAARLGWLTLLLTLVLVPLPYVFQLQNLQFAISQPILLILLGIVGVVILLAGRPRRL
jgi:hypothetical protein